MGLDLPPSGELPKRKPGRPRKDDNTQYATPLKKHSRKVAAPHKRQVDEWRKGEGLREDARVAIGHAGKLVTQVLRRGEPVNGILPEVALDKALSPAMLKVAGYEDKSNGAMSVQLVQLVLPQPGAQHAAAPIALLDAVRVLDAGALPLITPASPAIQDDAPATRPIIINDAVRHDSASGSTPIEASAKVVE